MDAGLLFGVQKGTSLVSHLIGFSIHFTDTHHCHQVLDWLFLFLAKSGETTSGHVAETHGRAGYGPNITNSQNMVARTELQNLDGAQAAYGPTSPIPLRRSTRDFTGEANVHNHWSIRAQHVYWQEQGRNALIFQQAGFERGAQEYDQASRDEVHVAVAQATEMSRAEKLARTGAVEQQAEQSWTSHQVVL